MNYIKNLLYGAVIGIAEIIPGVSGGTLAVLLGIYDELIAAISHFTKKIKENLKFLIPLLLGMGISILALSHVIKFLLSNYPMAVNFLFLGLIIGILPMLFKKATSGKFKPINIIPFFITLTIMVILAITSIIHTNNQTIITTMSFPIFLRFLIIGFLAAVCLILPGISGSMIMVIFGIYDSVINAISELNIIMLLPVGLGVILGILFGSKIIDYCLKKYSQATFFAILGLVLGSTISIYHRAGFNLMSTQGIVALITLIVGIIISFVTTRDNSNNKVECNKSNSDSQIKN